jgi:hypothetical protein
MLYFGLAGVMYGGRALLYAIDETGATIDFDMHPHRLMFTTSLVWLGNATSAENAIKRGIVARPALAVNNAIIWEWHARGKE